MLVQVSPTRFDFVEGEPIAVSVTVSNNTEVIGGYHLRLLGADPGWVRLDAENLSLFPGDRETVVATITIPPGIGAGGRRLAVQVRELTPPRSISVTEIELTVPAEEALAMRLEPLTVVAGKHAVFGVVVTNNGNTTVAVSPAGTDEEGKIAFRFAPEVVSLAPGEQAIADLRMTAHRRWFGTPVIRPFALGVTPPADESAGPGRPVDPPEPAGDPLAQGTFVQKPRLGRGALALLGLLLAVSVFAAVITIALSKLVGASAADRDLALQVAAAANAGAAAGGTAGLGGSVVLLTTGAPAPGVTVELFEEGQSGTPLASTATSDEGVWALPGLAAGKYQIRFRSAGFVEVWYPSALTQADAETLELTSGQQKNDLAVVLGGLPATLSGQVIGTDVAGAALSLQLPADQFPTAEATLPPGAVGSTAGAQVTSVPIASDGLFTLDNVASPAVYDLVVSKPGFASDTQRIDLGGGEDRSGITLRLRTGDGIITGTVNGPDGPLGEAVITATSGSSTVKTVSLTDPDVGQFTLRGLVTPGTYTVSVAMDGYIGESSSLTLSAGQTLSGVQLALARASGTLSGTVTTLADGQPAPGVTVTVTAGESAISTVTQSAGSVGSWSVSGLPIPSTYTVSFERADLQSQTVAVSLDGAGNPSTGGPLTVGMQSAFAIVQGTVTQQSNTGSGTAVGEATVELTAASGTYTVTTASTPSGDVGLFEIRNVEPGTYTLSAARKGTRPTSVIVTVTAGQVLDVDPVLIPPATLSGTVTNLASNTPAGGITVTLYVASAYPTTIYQQTTTDADGRYTFGDLDAPQAYVVEISTPTTGALASKTLALNASENGVADLSFGGGP